MRFVDAHARASLRGTLNSFLPPLRSGQGRGVLVVDIDTAALSRGGLGDAIEQAIEGVLATPPGLSSGHASLDRTAADRTLADQLYRARNQGTPSLALFVGRLAPLLTPMRVLDAVDAALLRFYALATKTRPVLLVLDASDEDVGAYGDPVPLRALFAAAEAQPAPVVIAAATTPVPPAVTPAPVPVAAAPSMQHKFIPLPRGTEPGPQPRPAHGPTATPPRRAESQDPETNYGDRLRDLAMLRGAQPLAGLESAFVASYVPLSFAIATGRVSRSDSRPYFDFRDGFERAYREAYPTLAQRTRRPKMVFDAPALAQTKARSQGARAAQLLVVDAMRFDMGVRLARRLAETTKRASLVGRDVLWALLPTTTERQMVGLVRGASALTSPVTIDASTESLRGKSAEVVRRIRFGARDIHRLDCIAADVADMEANPRENAEVVYEELKGSVERAVTIIAAYISTLPSRTLLYVLGDHGFNVTHDGTVHQGGGSPEEVLVPALAYLVSDLH